MKKIIYLNKFIETIKNKSFINEIQLEVEGKFFKDIKMVIIKAFIVPENFLNELGIKEKTKMTDNIKKKKQLSTKEILVNFIKDQNKRWDHQEKFNEKVVNFIKDQNKRWDHQENFNEKVVNFIDSQTKFNELLLSLPTIKKEISSK